VILLVGGNSSSWTPLKMKKYLQSIDRMIDDWPETQRFLKSVRENVLPGQAGNFSFDDVEAVVEVLAEAATDQIKKEEAKDLVRLIPGIP